MLETIVDREVQLKVPANDTQSVELSIVIPALNEQLTIGEFIDWCWQGVNDAGVKAEILIVDSSTDRTAEIALSIGARVLKTPKRGLGRAYIDALPYIRGRYVLMGDCDLTYDFRNIKDFVARFREGCEYVMGSRFLGFIEKGAMPPLHQYLGTPITTWMLNVMFSTKFSDIHCGMRGITTEALKKINLQSQSWEYASELVLKSAQFRLKTSEVPIRFYKDREGRLSHHKRMGWFSPWQAAWINMRAMAVYGSEFFLVRPGLIIFFLGLLLSTPFYFQPVDLGFTKLAMMWKLVGIVASTLGLQSYFLGIHSRLLFDRTQYWRKKYEPWFCYNRTVFTSIGVLLLGFALCVPLVREYVSGNYSLPSPLPDSVYMALTGLQLTIFSFLTFTNTLLVHGILNLRGENSV